MLARFQEPTLLLIETDVEDWQAPGSLPLWDSGVRQALKWAATSPA